MRFPILISALLAITLVGAQGGPTTEGKEGCTFVEMTVFDKGRFELQSQSGAFFSIGGGDRPTLNYSSTAYRLGIMLSTPSGNGCFRGNCEFLFQLFGGSVFDGPGNALGGATAILRYNFVQPGGKWVPYVELGAGGVYNDIYHDQGQRLIGQAWEFELEASVGIRYLFNDRWSAALEGGYRHISNADTNDRNVGLNSLGVSIGLARHF